VRADIVEAGIQTIGQFYEEFFPGRDIVADLERVQTFFEKLAGRIQAAFEPVVVQICEMAERLDKRPPTPGYEPMLIERGHDAVMARAVPYWTFGDLTRHCGANGAYLAAPGRLFEETIERAESLIVAATPALLAWAQRLYLLSQQPEAPGYEELLTKQLGQDPLRAKFMARAAHHLGKVLADEINQGRRVRAVIDEIAMAKESSTLVIARRAKRFRDECDSDGAGMAIDKAIMKAGLSSGAIEFCQLVEATCERDEGACRELGRTAALLAPHLPTKSGRPISMETYTHLMFHRYLEHIGHRRSYTYSELEGGNFVDPVTAATRLAVNKPRFSPRYANKLRKNKARAPSFGTLGSGPIKGLA
jgi:hypothetical protein